MTKTKDSDSPMAKDMTEAESKDRREYTEAFMKYFRPFDNPKWTKLKRAPNLCWNITIPAEFYHSLSWRTGDKLALIVVARGDIFIHNLSARDRLKPPFVVGRFAWLYRRFIKGKRKEKKIGRLLTIKFKKETEKLWMQEKYKTYRDYWSENNTHAMPLEDMYYYLDNGDREYMWKQFVSTLEIIDPNFRMKLQAAEVRHERKQKVK